MNLCPSARCGWVAPLYPSLPARHAASGYPKHYLLRYPVYPNFQKCVSRVYPNFQMCVSHVYLNFTPLACLMHAARGHAFPVFHVFHFVSCSLPDTTKQLPLSLLPTAPAPQAPDCASYPDSSSSESLQKERRVSEEQPEHMRRTKRKWVFRLEWKEAQPWLCYHVNKGMWCRRSALVDPTAYTAYTACNRRDVKDGCQLRQGCLCIPHLVTSQLAVGHCLIKNVVPRQCRMHWMPCSGRAALLHG